VDVVLALAILAAGGASLVVTHAAFVRFVDPETWRVESAWARRPRLAGAIERVAFVGLNPLRAVIFWLVLSAILLGILGVPALFYLLGKL
jgi:hypothetical protein